MFSLRLDKDRNLVIVAMRMGIKGRYGNGIQGRSGDGDPGKISGWDQGENLGIS